MNTPSSMIESRSVQETYAEGLRYFVGEGSLNNTLAQLSVDLKENGIDYIVIGAVALMAHILSFYLNSTCAAALSSFLLFFHLIYSLSV